MAVPECLADRYEIRGLLGRGGMGDVYEGWDRRLERSVAVKLLNPDLAAQSDIRLRFEHEARAAATLANAKTVAVFDTGVHDGIPYIVMERLPGRTLADEIADGPLTGNRVRAVLLDMLQALAAAHDAGIIHRDIKPSNVLLTSAGTTKLADFGIAKSTENNLTQTGTLVGTAAYLAPERVMGLAATPRSDIYSVGVVAFEALTGRPPFQADTPIGLVRAITDDPVPALRNLVPGVDETLAAAIYRATHKRPENRYSSAREMAAALSRTDALSGVPASTTPGTVGRTLTMGPKTLVDRPGPDSRKKGLLIGAASLTLLLLFILFNSGDRPEDPKAQPSSDPVASSEPQPAADTDVPVGGVTSVDFLGPGTLLITKGPDSLKIEAPDGLLALMTKQVLNAKLTLGFRASSEPANAGAVVFRLSLEHLQQIQSIGFGAIEVAGISEPFLRVEGIGSGSTSVSGEVDELTLSLTGSGDFDGSGLDAQRATAKLSGSGDARLKVSEQLQAELSGSGSVEFTGNPMVTQNASGSGRARKVE